MSISFNYPSSAFIVPQIVEIFGSNLTCVDGPKPSPEHGPHGPKPGPDGSKPRSWALWVGLGPGLRRLLDPI
uniref:Uncharacterized protein n=1 Tax=Acrobeloides nanus TaxID=290746 RepID=A0A914CGF0_9BILA